MSRLLDRLQEPEVVGCPVDGAARFEAHRAVLHRKAMIRSVKPYPQYLPPISCLRLTLIV